jgi:hypothetical protein
MTTAEKDKSYIAIDKLNKDRFATAKKTPSWKRFFTSYHTRDIIITMVFVVIITVIFLPFVDWDTTAPVVLIGGAGAGLRYLYDIGNQRIGMADAIASDILSIGRVFLSAKIVDGFVALVKGPEPFAISGFAGKARTENYFDVYEKYIDKIGSLDSECVRAITAFYKFLRASRDATMSLELWDRESYKDENKKEDVIHIVYQCLLLGANGEIVLHRLRDDKGKLAAAGNLVLVQIQSLEFLDEIVDKDDYRRFWIDKRVEDLKRATDLANSTILKGSKK